MPGAAAKNDMSWEDVLCSRTRIKVLKILKKYQRLNTTEIARCVGSNFTAVASHLKVLENEGLLTRADFGVRSHVYRLNESPRAKAIVKLLEAWE